MNNILPTEIEEEHERQISERLPEAWIADQKQSSHYPGDQRQLDRNSLMHMGQSEMSYKLRTNSDNDREMRGQPRDGFPAVESISRLL